MSPISKAKCTGAFTRKDHSGDLGYQIDGMINLPILSDHIAFRSASGYYDDPGFIDYPLLVQTPGVSLPQPEAGQHLRRRLRCKPVRAC